MLLERFQSHGMDSRIRMQGSYVITGGPINVKAAIANKILPAAVFAEFLLLRIGAVERIGKESLLLFDGR